MESLLKELRSDQHSGASDIARKAALGLVKFSQEPYPNAPTFKADLAGFGRSVIETQPAMAPLFNLVNQTLLAVEAAGPQASLEALQEVVTRTIQAYLEKMDHALSAIAEYGQGLLPAQGIVMTHSSSKTVIGVLRRAVWHGKQIRALATESRPFCEGRELGRHLGQNGIPTRIILDAAVARYVGDADIVVVGADRIAEESFVNKAGTLPLAMAAHEAGVPFYVACEMNKLLPASAMPLDAAAAGDESQGEEWMNVELLYSVFETIPNRWITGLITEEGILSLNALAKYFHAFRRSAALSPEPLLAKLS